MSTQQNILPIAGPFGGISRNANKSPLDCADCLNVIVDEGGKILTRDPLTQYLDNINLWGATLNRVSAAIPFRRSNNDYTLIFAHPGGIGPVELWPVQHANAGGGPFFKTILPAVFGNPYFTMHAVSVGEEVFAFTKASSENLTRLRHANPYVAEQAVPKSETITSVAAINPGAGAFITGTYEYIVTYVNENSDPITESEPATWASGGIIGSVTTGAGPDDILLTFPAATDTQVTHVYIYRKDPADGSFHFVKKLADTAGTFTDAALTLVISKTVRDEPETIGIFANAGLPMDLTSGAFWKERLWLGTMDGQVYFSDITNPAYFRPTNVFSIDERDDLGVRAIVAGSVLWVFKPNSIWAISGDSPDNFARARLRSNVGAVNQHSATLIGDDVYFCSIGGPQRINVANGQVEFIGQQIAELWKSETIQGRFSAQAAFDEFRRNWVVNVGNSGKQFVFNLDSGGWTIWDAPLHHVFPIRVFNEPTYGVAGSLPANAIDTVWRVGAIRNGGTGLDQDSFYTFIIPDTGDHLDFGDTEISWFWRSGHLDFQVPRPKLFFGATITGEKIAPTDITVIFSTFLDEKASGSTATSDTPFGRNPPRMKARIARVAEKLQFRIGGDTDEQLTINSVFIEAEAIGHR